MTNPVLALTGIRFVAAAWVVAFHVYFFNTDRFPVVDVVVRHGDLGVGARTSSDHPWRAVAEGRPSRVRCMPPVEVDQHTSVDVDHEAELVRRLEVALAELPAPERTAVVSAVAYAGGSVGAAMELGLELPDADALTRNGLQLLRAALADLDAHGVPLE